VPRALHNLVEMLQIIQISDVRVTLTGKFSVTSGSIFLKNVHCIENLPLIDLVPKNNIMVLVTNMTCKDDFFVLCNHFLNIEKIPAQ
jgi:hypothetical protein